MDKSNVTATSSAECIVLESTETFPAGTQMRLCSVILALNGARELANEADAANVLGILDLAYAELNRLNDEFENLAEHSGQACNDNPVHAFQ